MLGFRISAVKNSSRRRWAEEPASRTGPGIPSIRQAPGTAVSGAEEAFGRYDFSPLGLGLGMEQASSNQ